MWSTVWCDSLSPEWWQQAATWGSDIQILLQVFRSSSSISPAECCTHNTLPRIEHSDNNQRELQCLDIRSSCFLSGTYCTKYHSDARDIWATFQQVNDFNVRLGICNCLPLSTSNVVFPISNLVNKQTVSVSASLPWTIRNQCNARRFFVKFRSIDATSTWPRLRRKNSQQDWTRPHWGLCCVFLTLIWSDVNDILWHLRVTTETSIQWSDCRLLL